jgi:hypothetical protein
MSEVSSIGVLDTALHQWFCLMPQLFKISIFDLRWEKRERDPILEGPFERTNLALYTSTCRGFSIRVVASYSSCKSVLVSKKFKKIKDLKTSIL